MTYKLPTDPSEAVALARSPDLSDVQLEAIASSELPFLREEAALHPRSGAAILARLLPARLDNEVELRLARALSLNPNTPATILERLLGYLDSAALDGSRRDNGGYELLTLNILRHPNCPLEAGVAAIDRSARGLRIQMAKVIMNADLLNRLAHDQSKSVSSLAEARLKSNGA